jgi:hypothetical protein
MSHTDFLLENIGSNKVTLDIRTNRYEESYSYDPDSYEKEFNGIDNVLDMFSAARGRSRPKSPVVSQAPSAPSGPKPISGIKETLSPSSGFLYAVLLSLDPTLSLVDDRQLFVDKFRSELKDKARNFEAKLKRHGYSVAQAVAAVDEPADALYRYISLLLEKSLLLENSMEMYECFGSKQCLVINANSCSSRTVSLTEAYSEIYESKTRACKSTMTEEKLNTLLVKELKDLAESIGCEIWKLDEEGKKKNLLKSELRDKIKAKLFS